MKLFLSNLPFALDQNGLRELLESHGTVLSVKLVHEPGGKSRGFAFAEVGDGDWISVFDQRTLYGRPIRVSEAVSSETYQKPPNTMRPVRRRRPRRIRE